MAKLKAPLFSLGASGAIAKTLVYLPWKGLNNVREYVVPTNPKTALQTTQRGYFATAVEAIHTAQALGTDPLDEVDQMALSLLGTLEATPRTWFNQQIKLSVDQNVSGLKYVIYHNGTITPGATQLTVLMQYTKEGTNDITAGAIWYGTSKTNMIHSVSCTGVELKAGKVVPGLVAGVKYFLQYRPTLHADFLGANSGIYYGVPT